MKRPDDTALAPEPRADLFAEDGSLDGMWARLAADHIIRMVCTRDPAIAQFAHSKMTVLGVEVTMHIGRGGCRGLSQDDWSRIAEHVKFNGAEFDVAALSLGVLKPACST